MQHSDDKTTQENTGQDRGWLGRKVASGAGVGMAANAFYLFSRIVLTPFILAYVSLAEYGLWSVCFLILSYAGLTAFGVNNAYVKFVAEHNAAGNVERINRLMSTGLVCMTGMALVLFFGIWGFTPLLMDLFEVTPAMRSLAGFMIVGTAAAFLVDLGLGGFKACLEGMHEVALAKTLWLGTTLVETVLILVFLPMGMGIRGVLWAYVIKTGFEVVAAVFLCFRKLPGLRIGFSHVHREALPALFVFGGKIQILGLLGIFLGTFDRLVVSSMVGLPAVGLFEIGRKFPFAGRSVTGAAFTPILPAASHLGSVWEDTYVPAIPERVRRYASLVSFWFAVAVAAYSPLLWRQWKEGGGQGWFAVGAVVAVVVVAGVAGAPGFWRLIRPSEYLSNVELRDLFLRSNRYINLFNAIIYGFIIAAADRLIFGWVGPGYDLAPAICVIVSVMSFVNLATGAASSVFRGILRPGRELESMLVQLATAVVWIPGLAHFYGLMGAVWGTAASTLVSSLYYIWRANLAFRIGLREYAAQTLLPCIGPVCAAVLVYGAFVLVGDLGRWATVLEICVLGLVYMVLCGLMLRRVLAVEEWNKAMSPLRRLLGRG